MMVERDAEIIGYGIQFMIGKVRPYALRNLYRAHIAAFRHRQPVMRQTGAQHAGVEHRVVRDEDAALCEGRKLAPERRERRRILHHVFLDVVDADVAPVKFAGAGGRLQQRNALSDQPAVLENADAERTGAERRGVSGLEIECEVSHRRTSRPAAARSLPASRKR